MLTGDERFWIFAPPSVDAQTGAIRGTYTGATFKPAKCDSRYLWAQYRYMPPMAGYEVDPETPGIYGKQPGTNAAGTYHTWNRQYDPGTGRWTTPDPVRQEWRNPTVYMDNHPVNGTDPTGLFPEDADYPALPFGKKLGDTIVTKGEKETLNQRRTWNYTRFKLHKTKKTFYRCGDICYEVTSMYYLAKRERVVLEYRGEWWNEKQWTWDPTRWVGRDPAWELTRSTILFTGRITYSKWETPWAPWKYHMNTKLVPCDKCDCEEGDIVDTDEPPGVHVGWWKWVSDDFRPSHIDDATLERKVGGTVLVDSVTPSDYETILPRGIWSPPPR